MQQNWIIDVLTDLRTFAEANGLPALAEQLDDARMVASAEMASVGGKVKLGRTGESTVAQFDTGAIGTG